MSEFPQDDLDRHEGKTLRMVKEAECRAAIMSALRRNKTFGSAASELGLSRAGLRNAILRLGIHYAFGDRVVWNAAQMQRMRH